MTTTTATSPLALGRQQLSSPHLDQELAARLCHFEKVSNTAMVYKRCNNKSILLITSCRCILALAQVLGYVPGVVFCNGVVSLDYVL